MKIIYIVALYFCCLVLLPSAAEAQDSVERLLESIEQKNTQLKALREFSTAEKLENKTVNNFSNPEVEVTHKPKARQSFAETAIEATQSFDFPTAYKYRGQVIDLRNQRVDLAYQVRSKEILYDARLLIVNYIYQQKQFKYVEERVRYARELSVAYAELFEKGEISILERNKTKLYLLEAEKDLEVARVECNSTLANLERMNGGEAFDMTVSQYTAYNLPLEFDGWFERVKHNNPNLLMADKNVDASRKEEQLTRSLNLPKLRAGYVGDLMKNDSRHGVLVSVSVPLWEGRNTVKSKKAQTLAMQYEREDTELQYKNELKANFDKAQKLRSVIKDYSDVIDNSNNFLLLKKSFDMGQLDLIEYLQELIIFNDAVENYLSAEHDYFLTLAKLEQWER